MKFSLVMPCYKCDGTVKRAVESILDQDYENWELVLVLNGNWDTRAKVEKMLRGFARKDKRISILNLAEGNVCRARNMGAEITDGDYLSFFSSDFVMYPGALSKWKEALADGSDFVYSGYALLEDGKPINGFVPAEEFDPWMLRIRNYIDGGFPMKREVWSKGKWDPEIISLNDWDFWLTAIDNGFKGKMMKDVTYAAEVPKEGGLSHDSHKNWLARVDTIKKKHKIPDRDICVVSLGAQPHGKRIAKLLDADFQVAPQGKPNRYKAIYLIGFYVGNGESAVAHTRVFEGFNGKQIIHWIGTDVLQLVGAGHKVCYNDMKTLIDAIDRRINLSEFEQTEGELRSIGINSKIVPLPIEKSIDVMPLPKTFTVATYVPATATANAIYNLDFVKDVIKACPDINFLAFGGGKLEGVGANVKTIGWSPMQEVMAQSSCLLRFTYHDGMPVAPVEFRLAGRDAIVTVQMPYLYFAGAGILNPSNYAKRKEAVCEMIRQIKRDQKKGGPKQLEEARKYYLELTDPKKFKQTIRKLVNG